MTSRLQVAASFASYYDEVQNDSRAHAECGVYRNDVVHLVCVNNTLYSHAQACADKRFILEIRQKNISNLVLVDSSSRLDLDFD